VLAVANSERGALLVALPIAQAQIIPRHNIAEESRDDIRFEETVPLAVIAGGKALGSFRSRLLVYRSLAMIGAGEHALDLTISHVTDRYQFGSALSKRQVVQHYIAEMFGALAAARSACDAAMLALAGGADAAILAAALATRIEVDRMASIVTRLSHQLHGAIGFTEEHILQLSTKRLTAWRQDDLSETSAAIELARLVPEFGGPWDVLTAAGA
jgi:acyl-CoA dehydrogenase